ncbi:TPA: DUF2240 family protein [archaeon]|uniref:DUF2240 family protein n=1 Tax=Candidatus Naiadarchaeum limnaeum TaxID=2756139 RepID=A0A832V132_9ARCH|nr:DUF2240 family protein [Candidatus Naiadarchaeales archaeon SRR2090153.bin1042]HIK00161.1 DUF2240 family protein [Candidatus Naiadarchaeum limnaeum]
MVKLEELLDLASIKTGLSKEEILLRIRNKQKELSGLVSEEGAAYIVANELGVKTKNRVVESILKLKELKPEMKSVNVMGRVKSIYGPREFTTKTGIKNKVVNMEVVDSTGVGRVVLWNMHDIEKVEKGLIKAGQVIQVKSGYVRESSFTNSLEVHVGSRGVLIENPDGILGEDFPKIGGVENGQRRVKISNLKENEIKEVRAAITAHFGNNFVHEMCENCNKKVTSGKCEKCGGTKTNKLLILNLAIDDGSGTVRAAVFRETAERLIGLKAEEAVNQQKVKSQLEKLLGSELIFEGKVKRNEQFDRLEFNIFNIKEVKTESEIEQLIGEKNGKS